MSKGIVIGLAIAALCFAVYTLSSAPAVAPVEKTVDQMKAEVDPKSIELARASPEAALDQLEIENYPAFIAFLDLDMSVTDSSLAPYKNIFNQVAGYYANDTPVQIVEAIFRIYDTKQYFYDLTYRESLEYIQDTVPVTFDPETSNARSVKRIRVVADEIHDYLVAAYMKPQIEALEQQQAEEVRLQQRINANIGAMRARGASESAARARGNAQQNQYIQRSINRSYRNYNNRYYNRTPNRHYVQRYR